MGSAHGVVENGGCRGFLAIVWPSNIDSPDELQGDKGMHGNGEDERASRLRMNSHCSHCSH